MFSLCRMLGGSLAQHIKHHSIRTYSLKTLKVMQWKDISAQKIMQRLQQEHICLVKLDEIDTHSLILQDIVRSISCVDENSISDIQVIQSQNVDCNQFGIASRSDNDNELPLHSDSSFEIKPPKYIGIHYLSVDKYGCGLNQFVSINDILKTLSNTDIEQLINTKFKIKIPKQFQDALKKHFIFGSILYYNDDQNISIRYRKDLICTETTKYKNQLKALESLDETLMKLKQHADSVLIPENHILFFDNCHYLHNRTRILDKSRHLRRIKFN
eukprot:410724_1